MLNFQSKNIINALMLAGLFLCAGCSNISSADAPDSNNDLNAGLVSETSASLDVINPDKSIMVTDDSFVCLSNMQPVRGFFVGNLLGKVEETLTAAKEPAGAPYPPGSIVQLIPAEAMVNIIKAGIQKLTTGSFLNLLSQKKGQR